MTTEETDILLHSFEFAVGQSVANGELDLEDAVAYLEAQDRVLVNYKDLPAHEFEGVVEDEYPSIRERVTTDLVQYWVDQARDLADLYRARAFFRVSVVEGARLPLDREEVRDALCDVVRNVYVEHPSHIYYDADDHVVREFSKLFGKGLSCRAVLSLRMPRHFERTEPLDVALFLAIYRIYSGDRFVEMIDRLVQLETVELT